MPLYLALGAGFVVVLVAGLIATFGYFGKAGNSSAAEAKLRVALDAWQAGVPFKTFETQNPKILFVDSDWSVSSDILKDVGDGMRLQRYRIVEAKIAGPEEALVTVVLTFSKGDERKQYKVAYYKNPGDRCLITEAVLDGNERDGTEAEARALLRAALDSWSFGDDEASFKKKHPKLESFFEMKWALRTVLLRYDITGGRKSESGLGGFEFNVVLTFQSQARTELKEQRLYHVYKDRLQSGGRWRVVGK